LVASQSKSFTASQLLTPNDNILLHPTLEVRDVGGGDPNKFPSRSANVVQEIELVTARRMLVEIDLQIFPLEHSHTPREFESSRRRSWSSV
jgi:hypothetical protein